eukprot:8286836-Ditylum_brightwellii.AAC.1
MDSLQLFRLNGGLLNNDAVACNDSIIPALTSMHIQGLDLPPKASECSVLINQDMKHHVQTNAGESVEFYQHSNKYMKGGEGQGKTSSPPNWIFTSSTLSNSLEEQCTGMYLPSVDEKFVSDCVAEGFVNDTDAGTADQHTQNTDTSGVIAEKMRVIAQTWADLIH